MSAYAGKRNTTSAVPICHIDMWNTKKSWMGAPTINLIYAIPLTLSTYAQCTGPVATSAQDEAAKPVTVNRHTITSATSAARAAVWYAALVVGSTYSFSCKIRYNGTNTVSPTFYADASKGSPEIGGNNTLTNVTSTFTPIGNGVYLVRYTFTVSASPTLACVMAYGLWVGTDTTYVGNTFDVYAEQLEVGSFPTRFVKGNRSNTGAIADMSLYPGIVTTASVTYLPSDKFIFNGTTDQISSTVQSSMFNSSANSSGAFEVVCTPAAAMTYARIFGGDTTTAYFYRGGIVIWNGYYAFCWWDGATNQFLSSGVFASVGVPTHIVAVWDGGLLLPRIYINGALANSWSGSSYLIYSGGFSHYVGGGAGGSSNFNGEISVVKHYYNTMLPMTTTEINNSYESYRTRYGI